MFPMNISYKNKTDKKCIPRKT